MNSWKIMDKTGTDRAFEVVKEINTTQSNPSACVNASLLETKEPKPTITELKVFPVQSNC